MKEERVGLCFLACSTSRVRKACQSFGMRTKMSDKWVNYSYGLARTKQQVGQNIFSARTSQGHTHIHKMHLPLYSIICDWPWGLHPNVIFSRFQVGSLEILEIGTLATLKAHNLLYRLSIEVSSTTKLQFSSKVVLAICGMSFEDM